MTSYFVFITRSAMSDLIRNKMRTLLTSLGILIGVASVVLLIAFGLGLKNYIRQQFDSLGSNLIYIYPGQLFNKDGGFKSGASPAGLTAKFDDRDMAALKKLEAADMVVGVFQKSIEVAANNDTESSTLYGISPDFFTARQFTAEYGRLLDRRDVDKRSKVVVLGPKIAKKLFGSEGNALGKSIRIENLGYQIVGVVGAKGGGFGGPDIDSFTYMPYKTAYVINTDKKFLAIFVKAASEDAIPELKLRISQTMLKRYKEEEFSVIEQTQILDTITSIFAMLNSVLIAIGAISLIVGGVGIMNIMYVSVTERTKEIGVRRAIGATNRDILMQFLTESVVLSLFGGLLGLGISALVVLAVRSVFPASIDANAVAIALGVSSAVGITFGVFPAKKAADLSPIEAIRYE
jgi:putative ABC transport system permease protein